MPTIEDELQDLLATYGEAPVGTDRLGAVRRRIIRRRQVTIAGATVAILALAVAIPVAIGLGGRLGRSDGPGHQATSPAPNQTSATPMAMVMPEFYAGFRRVAQTTAEFPGATQFELTFTPRVEGFVVDADCRADPAQELSVRRKDTALGSADLQEIDCHPDGSTRAGTAMPPVRVSPLGTPIDDIGSDVTVGQTMTLVVTLRPWPNGEPGTGQTVHGRAIVGVYEPVPFADYPVPPRPAQLADLDRLGELPPLRSPKPEQLTATLDSRTLAQPSGTFELTFPTPAALQCAVDSVAPGELRFAVAGAPQTGVIFWDWEGRTWADGPGFDDMARYGIALGDPLTITITALHYNDPAWRIRCYDLGP